MIAAMLNRKLGGQGETKKARLFKQRKMEVLENGSKQSTIDKFRCFLNPCWIIKVMDFLENEITYLRG